MAPRIETDRYSASGIDLTAKAQRARYREGLYLISNPRRIFSDLSTNRYVRLRVTANRWRRYTPVAPILITAQNRENCPIYGPLEKYFCELAV